VTRPPGKPYASPDALRAAVTARARTAARADPRFTVTELLRQFAAFGVDLVGGPFPPLEPVPTPPLRPIDVPGLRDAPLRVYPLAATVADKLSGILTRHGERLSTRYRDLVDLATISLTERLAACDVHLAIHDELRRQGLAVPAEFAVPVADAWTTGYRNYARVLPHLHEIDFEQAVALVKALLDPVLGGRREGSWRPERRAWEP